MHIDVTGHNRNSVYFSKIQVSGNSLRIAAGGAVGLERARVENTLFKLIEAPAPGTPRWAYATLNTGVPIRNDILSSG